MTGFWSRFGAWEVSSGRNPLLALASKGVSPSGGIGAILVLDWFVLGCGGFRGCSSGESVARSI